MQYKALAFAAALAASVSAQSPIPSDVSASVLNVLLTALPPSAISLAATNQAAFESEMFSSLAAGNTPDWYQALPADVKTILPQMYPVSAPAETTADVTSTATTTAVETGTGAVSGKPTGGNNSTTTVNSPTLSTTGGTGGTGAPTNNGASYPTAVIGSGLAGALGVIGILAL